MAEVLLRRVVSLGEDAAALIAEAERDGRSFMRRLWDEWQSGANRFADEGEYLLSAHVDQRLVAMGGINRDPYGAPAGTGRLRHLYVSPDLRRHGVGRALVERVILDAGRAFSTLRLRTTTAEAAAFYERIGFARTSEDNATHRIDLPASLAQFRGGG